VEDKPSALNRPIGKPTFEDKVVQRVVVMLLEPIYEQVFHDFSHGFRRGRSQHQALRELREKPTFQYSTIPLFHVRGRNSDLEKSPLFFPPRRDTNSETFSYMQT
jgi:hypothetical protein